VQKCEAGGSWWKSLNEPKPYAFAFLILLGLILEFFVHYQLRIAVVYTHFYYLIIVLAGLWYGRKAILIAFFFGILHIVDTYLTMGIITPDSLIRTCMFVIVAFVIGFIVEQMNCYRDQLLVQNRELQEINTRLESSQDAFKTANKKLKLLSGITRHDIKNQLLGLMGFIELSKETTTDPDLLHFIDRETIAAQAIQRQIEFTKNYEDIGVNAPMWQDIGVQVHALRTLLPPGEIEISEHVEGLEVFADPLLEKVFENLIDNARRHGVRVRHISFSLLQYDQDTLAIVYEDDGIGVHETDKERIFEKGFGKNTGLGLFLSREILAITGLTIKESGVYGKGARFEIVIPQGKFRFVKPAADTR
jgi:signal transduction histidine kinase